MTGTLLVACASGCNVPHLQRRFTATLPPAAYILRAIVGDTSAVAVLLPPGASPHTYEPRPSDVRTAEEGTALFYVSPALDAWATQLARVPHIEMLALVPRSFRRSYADHARIQDSGGAIHPNESPDPHFWTDPLTVAAMLPALTDTLCALVVEDCSSFRTNAARFAVELHLLDAELTTTLAPLRGRSVVLFHPSFNYLLARYGIGVAAVIEQFPGKEPTPRDIEQLARTIVRARVKTILTEPQLPRRPAEVVAELAGVQLAELDPLGGHAGRDSYAALIRYNASVLLATQR